MLQTGHTPLLTLSRKKEMRNIFLIILVFVLTACSTHQIRTASPNQIKNIGQDIRVIVIGGSPDISNRLSRHIQANLLIEGFNIVNDEHATNLTVVISEFNPGNAALRLTIGLGAGRGSLVYNAKYSKAGIVLIDFDGAERFTGMEFAPGTKYQIGRNFGGEETATQILLEEAAKHIVGLTTVQGLPQ